MVQMNPFFFEMLKSTKRIIRVKVKYLFVVIYMVLFQDYSGILTALMAVGIIAIVVALVIVVVIIILALVIWRWAIVKFGGRVESLGQVFVTLLIIFILGLIASIILDFIPVVGIYLAYIVEILIGMYFISKRHDMTMGMALVAMIVAAIIIVLIAVLPRYHFHINIFGLCGWTFITHFVNVRQLINV